MNAVSETVRINCNNKHKWISQEIKFDIKNREALQKLSVKEPFKNNNKNYKQFRKVAISKLKRAKKLLLKTTSDSYE